MAIADVKTAYERVQAARNGKRPMGSYYIEHMIDNFVELHGDRRFGDDAAIVAGIGCLNHVPVTVIAMERGDTIEDRMKRNFGCPEPEGYRKALRLMRLAEAWSIPVVTLVDTAGAFPGLEAEARGQAEAIGRNLAVMARLKTPIVSVVTGEGGSGGAIGIAAADRVLMLENAIYSVISPEGCAAILWKDGKFAPQAAEALKITADDLLSLGVIDSIVPEPEGGAQADKKAAAQNLRNAILGALAELDGVSPESLAASRLSRFDNLGH